MSPSPSPSRRAQKVLLAATRGGANVIERTGGGEPLPTSASVPGQLMSHDWGGAGRHRDGVSAGPPAAVTGFPMDTAAAQVTQRHVTWQKNTPWSVRALTIGARLLGAGREPRRRRATPAADLTNRRPQPLSARASPVAVGHPTSTREGKTELKTLARLNFVPTIDT